MRGRLPSIDESEFTKAREVIIGYNIGGGLDITTGVWMKGPYGNWVLSGGAFNIMGIAGEGNTFKTSFMHCCELKLSARYNSGDQLNLDTELIYDNVRQNALAEHMPEWSGIKPSVLDDMSRVGVSRIHILDGTMELGEFHDELKKHVYKVKLKGGKSTIGTLPMVTMDGQQMRAPFPTNVGLDAISTIRVAQQDKILDEHEVGDSKANMYDVTGGRVKAQFFSDIVPLTAKGNLLMWIVAHVGRKFDMTGRGMLTKDMAFMAPDEKLKRCPDNFNFLTNILYHFRKVAPLFDPSGGKTPMYPIGKDDRFKENTDLMEMYGIAVRSKRGISGIPFRMAAHQTRGVLFELTEFHQLYHKDGYRGWGIGDYTKTHSYMELLPDVKFTRTTIHSMLYEMSDTGQALRQAMVHTLELCQMRHFWHDERSRDLVEPKDMYTILTNKGYDVAWLLSITHSWWTHDEDNTPWYALSTKDLIEMCHGRYHPYWLEDDKKTIKPEFKKRKDADRADREALRADIDAYLARNKVGLTDESKKL